jgi:hypothetical protein
MNLIKLINSCVKIELAVHEIDEIEQGFVQWVTGYERYAYVLFFVYYATCLLILMGLQTLLSI